MRVKSNTKPSSAASFLAHKLKENPSEHIEITAIGPSACLIAFKAIAMATQFVADSYQLACSPILTEMSVENTLDDGSKETRMADGMSVDVWVIPKGE